jgi:dUTP pyrophosphatase
MYALTQEQRDLIEWLRDGERIKTKFERRESESMRNVPVKIKRLHPDATVPQYATAGAAGFDLVAVEDVIIAPGETAKIRTGLAFELPPGYELQIRPRSGISEKTKLRVSNAPGTVDADYRGEVCVLVDNIRDEKFIDGTGYRVLRSTVETIDNKFVDLTPERFGEGAYLIRKGDRIAQGVIAPVYRAAFEEVDELSETARGAGGFGSTGVNV